MFLSLAFVSLAAATPAPAPYADDITILGERIATIKVRAGVKDGAPYCEVTQSSGDPALDALHCDAHLYCSRYIGNLYAQYDDALKKRSTRKAARRHIEEASGACLTQTSDRMLETLAEQRWQQRQAATPTESQ